MTPLEEKNTCNYPNCKDTKEHAHFASPNFRDHEAMIKQAVEEERQRILNKLPKNMDCGYGVWECAFDDGFNDCLSQAELIVCGQENKIENIKKKDTI